MCIYIFCLIYIYILCLIYIRIQLHIYIDLEHMNTDTHTHAFTHTRTHTQTSRKCIDPHKQQCYNYINIIISYCLLFYIFEDNFK